MEAIETKMEKRQGGVFSWLAWSVFLLCASFGALGVICLPTMRSRRAWLSRCARVAFMLSCIPLERRGRHHLSSERRLYVANHTSYLDVVVLTAIVPPSVAFVAKKELSTTPFLGWFLKRIGTHFVERFRARSSINDLNAIKEAVRSGESVLFFPEGTFVERDELLPFRLGAFLIAAETETPVVPITLVGAREVLPAGQWSIFGAPLDVTIHPPHRAQNWTRSAAATLRDEVRAAISDALEFRVDEVEESSLRSPSEKNNR